MTHYARFEHLLDLQTPRATKPSCRRHYQQVTSPAAADLGNSRGSVAAKAGCPRRVLACDERVSGLGGASVGAHLRDVISSLDTESALRINLARGP
jgi:hypothetical protein